MPSILVVEDEEVVRDFLSRFLRGDGFEVIAVGTGQEALYFQGWRTGCLPGERIGVGPIYFSRIVLNS